MNVFSFFSDQSFDHQLDKFGVELRTLKECATKRIFRAWIEDWEKEDIVDNDCVAEARLLEKYKNLVFYDPDDKTTFTVGDEELEFNRGNKKQDIDRGWYAICTSADGNEQMFAFSLLVELIAQTKQADGVQIIFPSFLGSSSSD